MTADTVQGHPATFTPSIVDRIVEWWADLEGPVLDPFAGTGTIHDMGRDDTIAIELEHEWAFQIPISGAQHTIIGDSLELYQMLTPLDHEYEFDRRPAGIVTSPAYGNRMADQYDGRDGSTRATYAISLGHECSQGSGAALQWGEPYRTMHRAHIEAWRQLLPDDGWVILNMKDHPRDEQRQRVCRWWLTTMLDHGFDLTRAEQIDTPGMRFGAQGDIHIDHEMLYQFAVDPDHNTDQMRLL